MVAGPTSDEEIEHHRGMEFERTATIFHLLVRLKQYSGARIVIEHYEDSAIAWSNVEGVEIFEDIQCKKIEKLAERPSLAMDDWRPGQLAKDRFSRYLSEARRGQSALDRLRQPNRFFTLFAYAEPAHAVRKYIPRDTPVGGFTRSVATDQYFPLDYAFPADPDPNSHLGTAAERRKIRVLCHAAPSLEVLACVVLNKLYRVGGGKTSDAFAAVESLLFGHVRRGLEARTFGLTDIEEAIRPFLLGTGKWLKYADLAAAEERDAAADSFGRQAPLVKWSDFGSGRFIHSAVMREGAEALDATRFLAIMGHHGCGKTVLCRYLIHEYSRRHPGAKCFYLSVGPGDELRDEEEVFRRHLGDNCLFVIDDAQLAEEPVGRIARAYLDRQLSQGAQARLIVATTKTSYVSARRSGDSSPLDAARHLRFDYLKVEEAKAYLAEYRAYRGLDEADDRNILRFAGSDSHKVNLGFALVLLHAAHEAMLPPTPKPAKTSPAARDAMAAVLESPVVREAVGRWLSSILRVPYAEYPAGVAAILTICASGLPIRSEFHPATTVLSAAGMLDEGLSEGELLCRIRPEYASLAWIVSRQFSRDHPEIHSRYLKQHNRQAPRLAAALASDGLGRRTLEILLDRGIGLFVPADRSSGIAFAPIASMVAAAAHLSRRHASALLRLCFDEAQGGYPPGLLHGAILGAIGLNIGDVTGFLRTAYAFDIGFTQRFRAMLARDDAELYAIFRALCESDDTIEDLLQFLRAAKNWNPAFGTEICPQLMEDPRLAAKWQDLADSQNPALLVRALLTLGLVNRRVCTLARDAYLSEALLLRWIDNVADAAGFVEFLSSLKRLSPRLASSALRQLFARRNILVGSLIADAPGLTDSSAVIASVARVDRRIAIGFARDHFDALTKQVAIETHYSKLGQCLIRLYRSTTPAIASDLAAHTAIPAIAEGMQAENRRFESIGRTLVNLAAVRPETAKVVAEAVDGVGLYRRIFEHVLMSLAHLTRGLLAARSDADGLALLETLRSSPEFATLFHKSLLGEKALHQVSDALCTLAAARLSATEIFRLFATDETGFSDFVDQRIRAFTPGRHSDLELANLLYALGRLGPGFAADALAVIVEVFGEWQRAEGGGERPAGTGAQAKVNRRRARSKIQHLDPVGSGALLHIASLIDDSSAKALLAARAESFRKAAAESNLGRHAVLLLGIHSVSRTECLKMMRSAYTPDHLQNLLELSQNPKELIQFLYTVQMISLSEFHRISSSLIRGGARELRDYLEAEVDLSEVSRWVMSLSAAGQLDVLDARALTEECAQFDTRLWALANAADAMFLAGVRDAATALLPVIEDHVAQARNVGKLAHCIQLWLKVDHVARGLGRPRVVETLAQHLLPQALKLIPTEEDHVCVAYSIRLWLDCEFISPSQRELLLGHRDLQLIRARLVVPTMIRRAVAAIILQPPKAELDEFLSAAPMKQWPLWAVGLLQVFMDGYANAVPLLPDDAPGVDLDQNNLKFGLACYAKRRADHSLSDGEQAELRLRLADESSSAVREILEMGCDSSLLRTRPFYTWTYLRRTVLALHYLDWETEVHRVNTRNLWNQPIWPDATPFADAAE